MPQWQCPIYTLRLSSPELWVAEATVLPRGRSVQTVSTPPHQHILLLRSHHGSVWLCVCDVYSRASPDVQASRGDQETVSISGSRTASGGRRSGRRVTFSPPDKGEKEPQEDNFLQVHCSFQPFWTVTS